jgi:hypothetical protein
MTLNYQIEDYDKIVFGGIHYVLPETVIEAISKLTSELDDAVSAYTNYQPNSANQDTKYKKPLFAGSASNIKKSRSNYSKKQQIDEDWVTVRNFKATVIDKKEGLAPKNFLGVSLANRIFCNFFFII